MTPVGGIRLAITMFTNCSDKNKKRWMKNTPTEDGLQEDHG